MAKKIAKPTAPADIAPVEVPEAALDPIPTDRPVTAFLVSAQVDGFRRGGRAWTRAATRVALDELTEAEIVALLAEPRLDVVPVVD